MNGHLRNLIQMRRGLEEIEVNLLNLEVPAGLLLLDVSLALEITDDNGLEFLGSDLFGQVEAYLDTPVSLVEPFELA